MRLWFTSRDWLWLCLVLALLIGWAVRPTRERMELSKALNAAHEYNDELINRNRALKQILQSPLTDQDKCELEMLVLKGGTAEIRAFLKAYAEELKKRDAPPGSLPSGDIAKKIQALREQYSQRIAALSEAMEALERQRDDEIANILYTDQEEKLLQAIEEQSQTTLNRNQ